MNELLTFSAGCAENFYVGTKLHFTKFLPLNLNFEFFLEQILLERLHTSFAIDNDFSLLVLIFSNLL